MFFRLVANSELLWYATRPSHAACSRGDTLPQSHFLTTAISGVDGFLGFIQRTSARMSQLSTNSSHLLIKKGCTPSQLALAWLLHQGPDINPNPGTKSIKYLEQNVDALAIELTEEPIGIRKFLENNELAGYRSTAGSKYFAYVTTKTEQ